MNPAMNGGDNMIPQVLQQNGATDENQDTILTTVRLEPNATSQISSVFILPKSGSVLDSNSSLIWSVSWDQYSSAAVLAAAGGAIDQAVIPKTFSGCLNSIRRARMYVGGRLLFENPDVALSAHLHKLSTNPDHYEEVEDCKLGSQHGVQIQPDGADATRGKFQTGTDGWIASGNGVGAVPGNAADRNDQLNRAVGSFSLVPVNNFSWEATLLLSDVFPALKHLQLPVKFLKDECRIEIDWETNFNEVLNPVANQTTQFGNITTMSINNPLLYLDYLTYNEEVEAGLTMASQNGIVIPYREMNLISKQLPASLTANDSQDIFLGFQGKLLMKIYVSHRFSNTGVTVLNPANPVSGVMAYQAFQGRCRSDMGENMKYNLIINDLHIHDAKVNTASQQYSYLSMTAENPIYAFPNSFDFNAIYNRTTGNGDAANADISSSNYEVGGRLLLSTNGVLNNNGVSSANIRDGIMGTQAFIGFDLSKYGVEGGLNAANAGFRVGSTPIILNIEQDGGAAAATRQALPKQVDVICESIKMLQIRNGMVDVMDA